MPQIYGGVATGIAPPISVDRPLNRPSIVGGKPQE